MTTAIPTQPSVPAPVTDPTTAVEVWAAVGAWAGAVGATFAGIAALWIAHQGWRRSDAERRDREMAQARLIVLAQVGGKGNPHTVSITNYSTAPVFDVVVNFVVYYDDPNVRGYGRAAEPVHVLNAGKPRMYAAVDLFQAVEKRDTDGNRVIATANKPVRHELSVTFVDAAGLRWRRTGQDQPVRVIGSSPAPPRRWWTLGRSRRAPINEHL